ncbi:hypothetical protein CCHR01_16440 [Colletotrichum chrysophilum]|uniref:Uncharacterized protein n=1 Tax=Colletotrichum chrysophilum TaxID=1836956 RepID=A0AAD9A6E0_9PEZI|nr:hypothetical protein CCHR01_16440 [Colletotrichum chrysophilum]
MPTAPPYLHSYPAEKRREVWLQWAVYNISPVFERFPGERAYVVFQLENLEWTKGTHLPPANSDSDAWCRLKQTWGPSEPPPKGTIPSVADCEVVRLLNKGYVHEYIELNLRKHGWDPYKCCDPSLKVEQKRLNAPSPAKPSSSAAVTPASTGARSSAAASSSKTTPSSTTAPASKTAPPSKTTGTGVPTSGATTGELRDRLIRAMSSPSRGAWAPGRGTSSSVRGTSSPVQSIDSPGRASPSPIRGGSPSGRGGRGPDTSGRGGFVSGRVGLSPRPSRPTETTPSTPVLPKRTLSAPFTPRTRPIVKEEGTARTTPSPAVPVNRNAGVGSTRSQKPAQTAQKAHAWTPTFGSMPASSQATQSNSTKSTTTPATG